MLTNTGKLSMQPPAGRRHARPSTHPLIRELGAVLIVKLVLLAGLWYAFFCDPPAPEPARLFAPVAAPHQETLR
jgi:hypothetical protein